MKVPHSLPAAAPQVIVHFPQGFEKPGIIYENAATETEGELLRAALRTLLLAQRRKETPWLNK